VAEKVIQKPLGQRLLEAGLINEAQLTLALNEHKRRGIYLGDALEELKILTQDIIAKFLAEESLAEIVDVRAYPIDLDAVKLIGYELARKHSLLPLKKEGSTLTAAFADTLDVNAIDALEQATGLSVEVVTAPKIEILEAIEQHYSHKSTIEQTIDEIIKKGFDENIDAVQGDVLPMISLVDQLISTAIKNRSTDIHFEPEEQVLRIRTRIDGVLRQEVLIPKTLHTALIARVKIMGDMDITEKRLPQDGRATFKLGTRSVDLRLSTMPTSNGEALVIRILDRGSLDLKLDSLGFSNRDAQLFEKALNNPFGMILVTGPTGSGKTTTLYSGIDIISTMERSILTVEDPIEYEMPLIRQTNVHSDIGMDFAASLRSMLRQDPDVIMVGEVRDGETAELAVRAALTGHLVLSTLHTNSAAGAIPRLGDMGIEPYLISASLRTILSQRLVRRICSFCKTVDPSADKELLKLIDKNIPADATISKGAGCNSCKDSGYGGRIGLYEILQVGEQFHDLIVSKKGEGEIERFAKEQDGHISMAQDGLQKVLSGKTTPDEVVKVLL